MKIICLLNVLIFLSLLCFSQHVKIVVISDLHYFDPDLLIKEGKAIDDYIAHDRKMIKESHAIFSSAFDSIKNLNPDILLVSGDLTKDGELSSHQKLATFFHDIENQGVKVYVCPGNHDINNPLAVSYNDTITTSVTTVNPVEFANIYKDFGYSEALYKDQSSLSYIAEPAPGLWVLSIDACNYKDNFTLGYSVSAGDLSWATRQWIKSRLKEAAQKNIKVIAFMHHNLLEHFTSEKTVFEDYIVKNNDSIASELAFHGLKVMFTGHFHAHDAIEKAFGKDKITDIETGSLLTYPCPYRIAELKNDQILYISGKRVVKINYPIGSGTFQDYALNFLKTGTPPIIKKMLMSPPYSLNDSLATWLTPAISATMLAHFEGNEGNPDSQTQKVINELKITPYSFFAVILESIWNDALPDDWNFSIDLHVVNSMQENQEKTIMTARYPHSGACEIFINYENTAHYIIYNIDGKMVCQGISENGIPIKLNNLVPGLYFIRIVSNYDIFCSKLLIR